jgi:Ku protein
VISSTIVNRPRLRIVDSHEIDAIYFEKPYYVVPADVLPEEAFVVLREALKRSHKIGLGQLVMRGREYVVSIKACGRGMVMETLRYADEMHKAASYFRDIGGTKPDDGSAARYGDRRRACFASETAQLPQWPGRGGVCGHY